MLERKLKVCKIYREEGLRNHSHSNGYRTIPEIILLGDWLKEAGFNEEDQVTVRYGNGKLTIKKL